MKEDAAWRAGTVIVTDHEGGFLVFRDPDRDIRFEDSADPGGLFAEAEAHLRSGGHVAGWLGYGLGHSLDRTGCPASPSGWLGCYRDPVRVSSAGLRGMVRSRGYARTSGTFHPERRRYLTDVARIREYIAAGEVYQVNYTGEFRFGFSGDPFAFFLDLLEAHPVPCAAFVRTEEQAIVSLSPELFFSLRGEEITVRPMKGTSPRHEEETRDRKSRDSLAVSEKDRAENLMIVDLMRNDLGRIAVPGTVCVEELFRVETYESVHQMTSTIRARIRSGTMEQGGIHALFRSLFPCGSVTGAPRIRAMQLIHELEARPRGVYTGAIGYFSPEGTARFNVAIRTVSVSGGEAVAGAGGGIVHDSRPECEYREALLKTRYLDAVPGVSYSLVETLLDQGGYHLLDLHLERMARSAVELAFPFSGPRAHRVLEEHSAGFPREGAYKVRLLLDRTGGLSVSSSPLEAPSGTTGRVAVWPVPVPGTDPFLRHKTTWRPWYADAAAERERAGVDDWLFLNKEGELTEGSISTLFLRKGGRFFTPPVESGLLPGVLRAHLLATRQDIEVCRLLITDLEAADEVLIGNSVRGLRPVTVEKFA